MSQLKVNKNCFTDDIVQLAELPIKSVFIIQDKRNYGKQKQVYFKINGSSSRGTNTCLNLETGMIAHLDKTFIVKPATKAELEVDF